MKRISRANGLERAVRFASSAVAMGSSYEREGVGKGQ